MLPQSPTHPISDSSSVNVPTRYTHSLDVPFNHIALLSIDRAFVNRAWAVEVGVAAPIPMSIRGVYADAVHGSLGGTSISGFTTITL
jgi:hypothetical protein